MKRITVFETTVMGLLAGVMISAYITFVMGTDGFLGKILEFVSLKPVLDALNVPADKALLLSFLFFVGVYALYGAILGLLTHVSGKMRFLLIPAILLLAIGAFLEQKSGSSSGTTLPDTTYDQTAALILAKQKASKKYFGTEATGDLNADGRSDVAFLTYRNDKKDGVLYYLTSAIATDSGREGTNMLFLGTRAVPRAISIADGIITVEYAKKAAGTATSTEYFYATIEEGTLIESLPQATSTATTSSSVSSS
jgi:hypothetical protein